MHCPRFRHLPPFLLGKVLANHQGLDPDPVEGLVLASHRMEHFFLSLFRSIFKNRHCEATEDWQHIVEAKRWNIRVSAYYRSPHILTERTHLSFTSWVQAALGRQHGSVHPCLYHDSSKILSSSPPPAGARASFHAMSPRPTATASSRSHGLSRSPTTCLTKSTTLSSLAAKAMPTRSPTAQGCPKADSSLAPPMPTRTPASRRARHRRALGYPARVVFEGMPQEVAGPHDVTQIQTSVTPIVTSRRARLLIRCGAVRRGVFRRASRERPQYHEAMESRGNTAPPPPAPCRRLLSRRHLRAAAHAQPYPHRPPPHPCISLLSLFSLWQRLPTRDKNGKQIIIKGYV